MPKFIIHKHLAKKRGVHYDLRIEVRNKVESYATAKGKTSDVPPDKCGKYDRKRLYKVIRTHDHDKKWLNYKKEFETSSGYGAGVFIPYDYGTYKVIKEEKKLRVLEFKGRKMKGIFVLLNLGNKIHILFKRKEQ